MLAVLFAATVTSRLLRPVSILETVELKIEPGESLSKVAQRLAESGVIRDAKPFVLYARALRRDRDIRHGKHFFGGVLDARAVLDELVSPPQPTMRVTIHEGLTFAEAGDLLEAAGVVTAEEYREAACDPDFVRLVGAANTANCSEGFLFPDTYNLRPGMTAEEIVRHQYTRFEKVLGAILAERDTTSARVAAYTDGETGVETLSEKVRQDLITLASIVQREAFDPAEQPLIASVFHNRLERTMMLQADPTIIYGLKLRGVWDGNIKRSHLREEAPYNTYTNYGLTPGPICNPGEHALRAALNPSNTEFLYFVAESDGGHRFSRTLAEHNRAVRAFQLGKH